jgi:hypothetical protein
MAPVFDPGVFDGAVFDTGGSQANGDFALVGSAVGSITVSAVAAGVLDLDGTADGTVAGAVLGEAAGVFDLNGTAAANQLHGEAAGVFALTGAADVDTTLLLTWDEIQFLIDQLRLSWTEVAAAGVQNNQLTLSWIETNAPAPLVFTWTELPAGLLNAYELDPQRPYGRVTKP